MPDPLRGSGTTPEDRTMNIVFCGGGALGSHALQLGRDLKAALAVVDDDRVESRNLASQWFVKQMVGKNKAVAL